MIASEAVTAEHVRKRLEALGYFSEPAIHVDERQPPIHAIERPLKKSGKPGTWRPGSPMFTVRKDGSDTAVVIECRAATDRHSSVGLDRPGEYALDGALHHARRLKDRYNVAAIAVSGEKRGRMKTSVYYWRKNGPAYEEAPHAEIDGFGRYDADFGRAEMTPAALRSYARRVHNRIRGKTNLTEAEKPLFVGAMLLALTEKGFRAQYGAAASPRKLARQMIAAIDGKLRDAGVGEGVRNALVGQFRFISSNQSILRALKDRKASNRYNSTLHEFVADMDESVGGMPLAAGHQDAMGEFYNEFVRYTGGDGKGLGIVLTPWHIAELAAELAGIHKNSKVLDICMGTGSFLAAAMSKMLTGDLGVAEIQRIRNNSLFGIEVEPDMFALACVNMLMRGGGRAHLARADCFAGGNIGPNGASGKCTVALMNPPYSQSEGEKELDFVERALDMLRTDGRCVVILPLSCASPMSGNNDARERILRRHTLESVMIMPPDLFPREGTHTCVMVFVAHRPHGASTETWLAIWDDDGHRRMKSARIDRHSQWGGIRASWLADYRSRAVTGKSLLARLDHNSEWTAYGHLDTGYESLTRDRFMHTVCEHRLCSLRRDGRIEDGSHETHIKAVMDLPRDQQRMFRRTDADSDPIDVAGWKKYRVSDYFDVEGTETTALDDLLQYERALPDGKRYPYVTTRETNTGVDGYYPHWTEEGGVICVDSATIGHSKYRHDNFTASDHVEKVMPKKGVPFDKYAGMFVETVLNLETFRYGYGRKFNQERIRGTEILLPESAGTGEPDWQYMKKYIKNIDGLLWL